MELLRIELVSICDLRFEDAAPIPWPKVDPDAPGSDIAARLTESFGWNFYGHNIEEFELYDLSSVVRGARGAALRVNPYSRVGSFILWRSHDGRANPHVLKSQAWEQSDKDTALLEPVFQQLRIDRIYPFLALQINVTEEDLDSHVQANAEELGRLFTGDLEGERPATLRQYVNDDLSHRAYEKLFLRWTEGLAVYGVIPNNGKHDACMSEPEFMEKCLFRAVQIFEHCVLAQVSLISIIERMNDFSRA